MHKPKEMVFNNNLKNKKKTDCMEEGGASLFIYMYIHIIMLLCYIVLLRFMLM